MWSRDRTDYDVFARELAEHGFATLTIDLRGHGGTLSGDGRSYAFDRLTPEDIDRFPNDIRAGIRYLREREDIDGVRVGLVGASVGANAAAAYSVDDHLLAGLVLLSPAVDYKGIRAADAMAGFGRRPSFLLASKEDQVSFHSLPILKKKAKGEVKMLRVDGDSHGTEMLVDEEVRTAITDWLDDVFKDS
jgi:alpha-beta hydrolase superfamily lysophospholipase